MDRIGPWRGASTGDHEVNRLVDVTLTTPLMVLSAPVQIVLALLVRLDSPGPAFYSAQRVGYKGRRFRCWKLRTMSVDADMQKDALRKHNGRELVPRISRRAFPPIAVSPRVICRMTRSSTAAAIASSEREHGERQHNHDEERERRYRVFRACQNSHQSRGPSRQSRVVNRQSGNDCRLLTADC